MKLRTDTDMTGGNIWLKLLGFSVPMMLGLLFQQLYATVDAAVVGRFVSKQALAAVGCNSSIINTVVGTFAGLSTGASVVISQAYGAHDDDRLSRAVHTTMAICFILCAVGTAAGCLFSRPLLMLTGPDPEVVEDALVYLRIYFLGVSGLLIYNMGTGILRAVGDSTRPLYFLILTAIVNTALDLLFVQAYINSLKTNGMAAWTAYNRLDAFLVVPLQAIAMASTTFVGQCWGAKRQARAREGVRKALLLSLGVTAALSALTMLFARPLLSIFIDGQQDAEVMEYGRYFVMVITPFYVTICFNQIYSGALRGIGCATAPTVIMLSSFVVFRQIFLFVTTRIYPGSRLIIALAYPMGWIMCSLLLILYYKKSALGQKQQSEITAPEQNEA